MSEQEPESRTTGREAGRSQGPRKILEQTVRLDLSRLDQEQIDQLQTRLRELSKSLKDPQSPFFGIDLLAGHSSHGDDDGWF